MFDNNIPSTPKPEVLYSVYVNYIQVGVYDTKEAALDQADEIQIGHIIVKTNTGDVLIDENRTKKTSMDPRDAIIKELEQKAVLLKEKLEQITNDRDNYKLKIDKIIEVLKQ